MTTPPRGRHRLAASGVHRWILVAALAAWGIPSVRADAPAGTSAGTSAGTLAPAAVTQVKVVRDDAGAVLEVDGAPFLVRGMNWDHIPVGQNYRYGLWAQDDATIERVLAREMPLLQGLGVNVLRQYDDIPARWVETVYRRWGIRTMVNPLFGRYGLTVDGVWVPQVDYAKPAHRAAIRVQTLASVERLKGTPGVLLWLLGNENNYGLGWTSFEIGNLPQGEQDTARAAFLYSLYGEVVDAIHATDSAHPVAICNGDLQYLDLVKKHVPNLDVFGTNVYRGRSGGDLYARVRDTLGVPVLYTEFGADAFDARRGREDTLTQADFLVDQWQDVYAHTRGHDVGNAIGGFVFQWADGWWKTGQDQRLDVHDTHASWANGGYPDDFAPGRDNMNEEWFGVAARLPDDGTGTHGLVLRPAAHALRDAWNLDPYAPANDLARITTHFDAIQPALALPTYEATMRAEQPRAWVRDAELRLLTFTTQDSRRDAEPTFGHTESATLDVGLRPTPMVEGQVAVNALGAVAWNLLDPLTWETRGGRLLAAPATEGANPPPPNPPPQAQLEVPGEERVRIARASLRWELPDATVTAFHRVGHGHWGYDGDAFGLYREAYYGPNLDTYAAEVPSGVEVDGQGRLKAFALAAGPQLWWGANPSVLGKARGVTGPVAWTFVHQEDVATQGDPAETRSIPVPRGRASSLDARLRRGRWDLDAAALVAGTEHLGQAFVEAVPAGAGASYADSGEHLWRDEIRVFDTLGGRAKVSWAGDRVQAYALGTYRGLVADAGPDATTTFTGWSLKDHGVGNVSAAWAGAVVNLGAFQVAPNLHAQRPLAGPLPSIAARWEGTTGWYDAGARPRNIVDDPFAVSSNRETYAAELLLAWDPTPASWWWAWDAEATEDAPLGASLDVVYRHQPTSRDASIGFSADGTLFTFGAAPPAADIWDATLRLVATPGNVRVLGSAFAGTAQSSGQDARSVLRRGGDVALWRGKSSLKAAARWGDWGPYDYYRTFNLTFPFQSSLEIAHGVTGQRLPSTGTRVGLRGTYRTLDAFSPDVLTLGDDGQQFEVATFLEARL